MIALIDSDSIAYKSCYKIYPDYGNRFQYIENQELSKEENKILKKELNRQYRIALIQDIKKDLQKVSKESLRDFIIEESINRFYQQVGRILQDMELCGCEIKNHEFYFTWCKNSFRKKLSKTYKTNRKPNKIAKEVIKRLIEIEGGIDDELEADDLIAERNKELMDIGVETIIVSIDKDLKQIEGLHFDYQQIEINGNKTFKGLTQITKKEAEISLAYQMVIGDTSDNIKGLTRKGLKWCETHLKNKSIQSVTHLSLIHI
jgi:hypothetical protein